MVRSLDAATQTAVRAHSRLVIRDLVTIITNADTFGFWSEPETVAIAVVSGETGSPVTRTFVGDGAILRIDPVPLAMGLEVRTVQVVLSQIHAGVQDMVRGHDIRLADVEIHRAYLDPDTMLPVANPRVRHMGKVNGAPIDTPAAGAEGSITLKIVSHTRELTRTNPAKRSYSQQLLRSSDDFRRYAGVAIPVWWGVKKGAAK